MSAATQRLALREVTAAVAVGTLGRDQQAGGVPLWHDLRLFGPGRHPDTYDGGAPVQARL